MNLYTLSYKAAGVKEFVSYWSSFYDYPLEELYTTRIDKKHFSKDDLEALFKWKNGGNLSQKKQKALQAIIDKLNILNRLKDKFCLETFLREFKFVKGAIWKIFLLHVTCPAEYPIFDQHVCRALYFMFKNQSKEIPTKNTDIEKLYFDEYMLFFNSLAKNNISRKKLDEALWAFGKFLKTHYAAVLIRA